jgi:hypothetical protein
MVKNDEIKAQTTINFLLKLINVLNIKSTMLFTMKCVKKGAEKLFALKY